MKISVKGRPVRAGYVRKKQCPAKSHRPRMNRDFVPSLYETNTHWDIFEGKKVRLMALLVSRIQIETAIWSDHQPHDDIRRSGDDAL